MEKRTDKRHRCKASIAWGCFNKKKLFNAKMLNYSKDGMYFECDVFFKKGANIYFQMNDCRVQSARKRKGLDDYPCKSGGLVEYTYFARSIDERIKTECIGCPPDDHPEDWFCAWRFYMDEDVKKDAQ